jgi:NAD(P)-dependent dehydrogenase (short-subunit alcohol dehydrogenase family)
MDGFLLRMIRGLGKLDTLINNAGISPGAKIQNLAEEDFDRVIRVNFTAARTLTEYLLPKFGGEGAIINILSRAGFEGRSGLAAYALSKGLLSGYTLGLSRDLVGYGPRVYGVNPGFMTTGMATDKALRIQRAESILGTVSVPETSAEIIYCIARGDLGPGPFFDIDSRIYRTWTRS